MDGQRVARLATADTAGRPHVVPVCFVTAESSVYITVDEKPKTVTARPLKRIRNILENGAVALVIDHYDEDWSRLAWVMVRGLADILESCPEHNQAQERLEARYPQLRWMALDDLPVIAIRVDRVTSWGNLEL